MEEQEEKLETQQLGILEKTLNDNGERLIELCTQTSLNIWMNILVIKIYTNIHGKNKKKNLKMIIDYIITKQDLKLKIQDVRA